MNAIAVVAVTDTSKFSMQLDVARLQNLQIFDYGRPLILNHDKPIQNTTSTADNCRALYSFHRTWVSAALSFVNSRTWKEELG